MKILRHIFTAACLLIILLGVILWIRGYYVRDTFALWHWRQTASAAAPKPPKMRQNTWGFDSSRGKIELDWYVTDVRTSRPTPGFGGQRYATNPEPLDVDMSAANDRVYLHFAGVIFLRHVAAPDSNIRDNTSFHSLIFPTWFTLIAFLPPLLHLRRHKRSSAAGFEVTTTPAKEV